MKRLKQQKELTIITVVIVAGTVLAAISLSFHLYSQPDGLIYSNNQSIADRVNAYLEARYSPGMACRSVILAYDDTKAYADFACVLRKGFTVEQTHVGAFCSVGRASYDNPGSQVQSLNMPSEAGYTENLKKLLPRAVYLKYQNEDHCQYLTNSLADQSELFTR